MTTWPPPGPVNGLETHFAPGGEQRAGVRRDSNASLEQQSFEKEAASDFGRLSKDSHRFSDIDFEKGPPSPRNESKDAASVQDASLVFWDGPDDPQNPMNWSEKKKWSNIALVSFVTFLSPLGSAMISPSVPGISKTFDNHSELLDTFVVSVYVLGFAVGPLAIAPMSEMWGRIPLYHACQILFIIFNLGCALSTSMGMLIAFRFLTGCAGSAPLSLGGGTVADMFPREQRVLAMALWISGPTLGPSVGPVAGGFIVAGLGWRWTFWILMMLSGFSTALGVLFMRETYAPSLLERKAKRLRKETGNTALRSKLDKGLSPKDLFFFSIARPTKMLLFCPTVQAMCLIVAIDYAYLYIFFTTFTKVYEDVYHFPTSLVGLSCIGLGVGQMTGQVVYTTIGDRRAKQRMKAGLFVPEDRLPPMVWGSFFLPVGLFIYAWTVQNAVQWIVPIIATGLFGFGLLLVWMPAQTYLVDFYTEYAASAMAANTVSRSVLAALLPLAGPAMYRRLGQGWGNSLLGFIAVALLPLPVLFIRYGERIRKAEKVKL